METAISNSGQERGGQGKRPPLHDYRHLPLGARQRLGGVGLAEQFQHRPLECSTLRVEGRPHMQLEVGLVRDHIADCSNVPAFHVLRRCHPQGGHCKPQP
ncbi:hypothetical protein E2C01_046240 [Portunus trituberculatus]|uniref:Uncharacterized protein n=1 Tax=Portunus trituberculatus TaxID=210409 RepID=A0A5B7FXX5_PORTR|nr:hypothetical protein [Portunus trituberculatus]